MSQTSIHHDIEARWKIKWEGRLLFPNQYEGRNNNILGRFVLKKRKPRVYQRIFVFNLIALILL